VRISEYINREIITIKKDISAIDALGIMTENHIHNIPVVSDNNELLGFIESTKILDLVFPNFLKELDPAYDAGYGIDIKGYLENKKDAIVTAKVQDVLSKPVYTLTEESSFVEALDIFVTRKVRKLAIIDNSNILIGLLYQHDLMKDIYKNIVN